MQIQVVNATGAERIYGNYTNYDGQTITAHYPVFFITATKNSSSVDGNAAAQAANAALDANGVGTFAGLAAADCANGAVGRYQCYGYHESVLIWRIVGSVSVVPGHPLGPGNMTASVGVNSNGHVIGFYGPMVAMDTVTATMISLGTVNYANHVFLRSL